MTCSMIQALVSVVTSSAGGRLLSPVPIQEGDDGAVLLPLQGRLRLLGVGDGGVSGRAARRSR